MQHSRIWTAFNVGAGIQFLSCAADLSFAVAYTIHWKRAADRLPVGGSADDAAQVFGGTTAVIVFGVAFVMTATGWWRIRNRPSLRALRRFTVLQFALLVTMVLILSISRSASHLALAGVTLATAIVNLVILARPALDDDVIEKAIA